MSLHGIIGLPGSGKTALACKWASEMADQQARVSPKRRRDIYLNFPVTDERIKMFSSFEELTNMSNVIVFYDEFANAFGKRSWSKTTDEHLTVWRQSRHDGMIVYWLAHHIEDVETKIASELTSTITYVHRVFGPNRFDGPTFVEDTIGIWATYRKYHARDYVSVTKRKTIGGGLFRVDAQFGKFNSDYVIGLRDGSGAREGRSVFGLPEPVGLPLINPEIYSECREVDEMGFVKVTPTVSALNGWKKVQNDGSGD